MDNISIRETIENLRDVNDPVLDHPTLPPTNLYFMKKNNKFGSKKRKEFNDEFRRSTPRV